MPITLRLPALRNNVGYFSKWTTYSYSEKLERASGRFGLFGNDVTWILMLELLADKWLIGIFLKNFDNLGTKNLFLNQWDLCF